MLCYSKDGLQTSLTTLPSEALQTEALKLFKVFKQTLMGFNYFALLLGQQYYLLLLFVTATLFAPVVCHNSYCHHWFL